MASGSICKTTGMRKKDCYCWDCQRRRNNAQHRSGYGNSYSGHQDSRKVHDTKGKNNHGRKNW
ncbi:hypothetical protein IKE98_01110 [Candidatus Saccharibacteria bacterium]|nr:hypothetical protein [Candidatus Saccharibacteria bacterium]